MRLMFTFVAVAFLSTFTYAVTQQAPAPGAAAASPRFDFEVRADFFAGLTGDAARFARAMARCEEVLAADPDHAEALVWHGAGLMSQAGALFMKGDTANGIQLWTKALGEMNRAVGLAPDQAGVRIPRGATLFDASRHVPEAQRAPLLKLAIGDFEHTLKLQEAYFSKLSDHAKGELLFGLADGWARAGDEPKAREYFTRLMKDASRSGRAAYAQAWLDGKPPAEPGGCVGCH
jgi:tetratricopeptide (TPR) repeat protein